MAVTRRKTATHSTGPKSKSTTKSKPGRKPAAKKAAPKTQRPDKTTAALQEDELDIPPPKTKWKKTATKKTTRERTLSVPDTVVREPKGSSQQVEKLLRFGPDCKPVRDGLGYELSYRKASASRSPWLASKEVRGNRFMKAMEEDDWKAQIMGCDRKDVSSLILMAWDDVIARDLDIPYHMVKIRDYEEWYRRGFRCKPDQWKKPISENEINRINTIAEGSEFRK